MMEQDEVLFEPFERSRAALRALGLGDQALHPTLSPMIGSTGNRFLLLPLANPSSLRQIRPNLPAIEALSERFGLIGFYPFALTKGPVAAAARMFAPAYGIAEEAATGMAAGPLGAYLRDYAGADAELLTIAQGAAMRPASPSRLLVDVSQPKIWVGGQARMSASMA
jgi:PhzF family phenazine biosynthesis protein